MPCIIAAILICAFISGRPAGAQSTIHVEDGSGAPASNVLVIVKSLDMKKEIFRGLTNVHGKVSIHPGSGKLFRVIAVDPYGSLEPGIIEATSAEIRQGVSLELAAKPSDEYGMFLVNASSIKVNIENGSGAALANINFLVRDPEARTEEWYISNAKGEADVTVPSKPFVISVLHDDKTYSYLATFDSCNASTVPYLHCILIRNNKLTLDIAKK